MTTEDERDEQIEAAWTRGKQFAYQELLRRCIRELGAAGRTLESLIAERADAITVLRRLCGKFGDNDWTDDLHLADIIDKHLGRALEEAPEG